MNIGHNIPEGSCNACGGTTLPTPTQDVEPKDINFDKLSQTAKEANELHKAEERYIAAGSPHQPSEGWDEAMWAKAKQDAYKLAHGTHYARFSALLDDALSALLATARREERGELREKVEALKKNPDGTCECGICEKRRVFNDAISSVIDLLTQKKG